MKRDQGDEDDIFVPNMKQVSNALEAQTWLRSTIRKHWIWQEKRKFIFKRFGVKHLEQIPKDCMLQIAHEFGIDLKPLGKYAMVLEEKPKGGLSRNKLKSAIRSHPAFHASITGLFHLFDLKDHLPRTSKCIDYMGRGDLEKLYSLLHAMPPPIKAEDDTRIVRKELRKQVSDLLARMEGRSSFLRRRYPELRKRNVKPNLFPSYLRVSQLKQLLADLQRCVHTSSEELVPASEDDLDFHEHYDDDDYDDHDDQDSDYQDSYNPKRSAVTALTVVPRKRRAVVQYKNRDDTDSDCDYGGFAGRGSPLGTDEAEGRSRSRSRSRSPWHAGPDGRASPPADHDPPYTVECTSSASESESALPALPAPSELASLSFGSNGKAATATGEGRPKRKHPARKLSVPGSMSESESGPPMSSPASESTSSSLLSNGSRKRLLEVFRERDLPFRKRHHFVQEWCENCAAQRVPEAASRSFPPSPFRR